MQVLHTFILFTWAYVFLYCYVKINLRVILGTAWWCFVRINCLSPFSFVGLSAAGMLGRMGRSMSFDNSANGYARGEAAPWLPTNAPPDVERRPPRAYAPRSGVRDIALWFL